MLFCDLFSNSHLDKHTTQPNTFTAHTSVPIEPAAFLIACGALGLYGLAALVEVNALSGDIIKLDVAGRALEAAVAHGGVCLGVAAQISEDHKSAFFM